MLELSEVIHSEIQRLSAGMRHLHQCGRALLHKTICLQIGVLCERLLRSKASKNLCVCGTFQQGNSFVQQSRAEAKIFKDQDPKYLRFLQSKAKDIERPKKPGSSESDVHPLHREDVQH